MSNFFFLVQEQIPDWNELKNKWNIRIWTLSFKSIWRDRIVNGMFCYCHNIRGDECAMIIETG